MAEVLIIQGRKLSAADLAWVRNLMVEHPAWGRSRISLELCRQWGWHNQQGRPKDMAARTLLLKLERAGHWRLPRRRTNPSRGFHNRTVPLVAHTTEPIRDNLYRLRPLAVSVVRPGSEDLVLFNTLLSRYHYLGHRNGPRGRPDDPAAGSFTSQVLPISETEIISLSYIHYIWGSSTYE